MSDGFLDYYAYGELDFENQGLLRKSGGTGAATIEMNLTNQGTITVQSGTLRFAKSFTQTSGNTVLEDAVIACAQTMGIVGGQLSGRGTIDGSVAMSAGLDPGLHLGLLTITGNYVQYTSGQARVEIAGTGQDQVAIGGSASLDGDMQVEFIEGYAPETNTSFTVMIWNSRSGAFSSVEATGLTQGLGLDVLYGSTGLVLTVVSGEGSTQSQDVSPAIRVTGMTLERETGGSAQPAGVGASPIDPAILVLMVEAEPSELIVVEASIDLESWYPVDVVSVEWTPGRYEVRVSLDPEAGGCFVRIWTSPTEEDIGE